MATTKNILIEDTQMNEGMQLWKGRHQERERGTKKLQKYKNLLHRKQWNGIS